MTARKTKRSRHRLVPWIRPSHVALHVDVAPERSETFRGEVKIQIDVARSTKRIRLHAVGLRVTRPRIEFGNQKLRGRVEVLRDLEMVEISFDQTLSAGPATLTLAFAGKLRDDLCGLYGVRAGGRRYAFTQLEATDARKFFPCFDEPAMKARFTVSVTTSQANTVLSNAPIESTTRSTGRRGPRSKTVLFATTPPLSTYLLALAVGVLESSRPTYLGPTEIRVWHTPGQRRLTRFGLEAARECLSRLERYFGIPYPYAKLDLVAVPDFEFGAMENAGAVFFRETLLLLDRSRSTLAERKRAAEVICHELAHMWYGDLVTMEWWDDLWLNEAFATWMAFHIVDQWQPDWKMWQDFQHGRSAALSMDALRHSHPIYVDVRTAEQASENFDLITYEKGASVVRMLERYLGAPSFRKGVRAYIREHREGNAVADDLWNALSQASGQDVKRVARAWIEQEGYPVVSVQHERSRGRSYLNLRQERFLEQTKPRSRRRGTPRWPVPLVARVGSGRRARDEKFLLERAQGRWPLGRTEPRFVYANSQESGFYRPLHSDDGLTSILQNLSILSPVERMGLVDHQWALVRAGRAPVGSILDLTRGLARDTEADVLKALRQPLAFLGTSLIPDAAADCAETYGDFLTECFAQPFEQLGWKPSPREDDATRVRRAVLLSILGGIAAPEAVLTEASRQCQRYLDDHRAVDANLADDVVFLAARSGGARLHRDFVRAMEKAATPQDKRRFLFALARFRAPAQIDRSLAMTLTPRVATQDVIFVLVQLLQNPAASETTWEFIVKHWGKLRPRLPSLMASRLIEATPALRSPARRRDVATFFRRNPVPGGDRALRQALERFDWYRGFRRRAASDLRRTLEG